MTTIVVDTQIPVGTYTLTPVGAAPPGPTGATGATGPAPGPTAPPPPTIGCTDVFQAPPDADWTPKFISTKVFPDTPISASGDRGVAIKFVADAAKYPTGIQLDVFDQSGNADGKDVVISLCPHDFDHPVGPKAALSGVANLGSFYLRFGTAANPNFETKLTPGATYYINMRPTAVPRGTVSSQFYFLTR